MALRRAAGYVATLIPLCLSHFIIPPLSALAKNDPEQPPEHFADIVQASQWSPSREENVKVFNRMMFFSKRTEKYNIEQVNYRGVSHMFLHINYAHIEDNLTPVALYGYLPYRYLGAIGFYAVFLLGGLYAAANNEVFALNLLQEVLFKLRAENSTETSAFSTSILSSLRYAANQVVDYCANQYSAKCGSSAGVYAITGCGLSVMMPFSLLRNAYNTVTTSSPPKINASLWTAFGQHILCVGRVGLAVLMVVFSNELIASELDGAHCQIIANRDVFVRMQWRSEEGRNIDHVAHINGLHVGVAVGLGILLRRRFRL